LIGAAEARAIEAVGRAEAEKMRMKASAYKQYGDAAVMALVLEALPQVCKYYRLDQGSISSKFYIRLLRSQIPKA
jgi:uncharacterized membrane protein YqiK